MKTPCEIVVWYVLPAMRSEIARALRDTHHMKQSDIGKLFGVTDAAVSQYLNKKRGVSKVIEESPLYEQFLAQAELSAARLATGKVGMVDELCRICTFAKRSGLMALVYTDYTDSPAPPCARGAHINVDVPAPDENGNLADVPDD